MDNQLVQLPTLTSEKEKTMGFRTVLRSDVSQEEVVIIGGGIAGLLTAMKVTKAGYNALIIDHGVYHSEPVDREAVFQSPFVHFASGGFWHDMEVNFPNVVKEIEQAGAPKVHWTVNPKTGEQDVKAYYRSGSLVKGNLGFYTYAASRKLLDFVLHKEATEMGVRFLHAKVVGLLLNEDKDTVIGVKVRNKTAGGFDKEYELTSEWVIDASGRNSSARKWLTLADAGFDVPAEKYVNAELLYVDVKLHHAPNLRYKVMGFYESPANPRGAGLVRNESGIDLIMFVMGNKNHPSNIKDWGWDDIHKYTKCIHPTLYDALVGAVPTDEKPHVLLGTALQTQWTEYWKMRKFPLRFLIIGDAVEGDNPRHGRGIGTANIYADAVVLSIQNDENMAQLFERVRSVVEFGRTAATTSDFQIGSTKTNAGKPSWPARKAIQFVNGRLQKQMTRDVKLASTYLSTFNDMQPPETISGGLTVKGLIDSFKPD